MSRQYEAILIFPSQYAGEKLEDAKKTFADLVQKQGGSVTGTHEIGRRAFNYVIKKHKEGAYFVFDFTLDPAKITELKRALTLTESILRANILIKQNIPISKAPVQQQYQRPVRPAGAPKV